MSDEPSAFQRGNRLFVRQDYAGAIREYEAHAAAVPADRAKALAQIALCYLNTNTAERPKTPTPWPTLLFEADKANARKYFELALAADGDCMRALCGLADLLPESAPERRPLLERAAAVQPTYPNLIALGDYYCSVDRDFAKAYATYAVAQLHSPREPEVYEKLVEMSKRLIDPSKEAFWKAERERNRG
jgi:tetratricopeptide (TPR) repeat protein